MRRYRHSTDQTSIGGIARQLRGNKRYLWTSWAHALKSAAGRTTHRLLEMAVAGALSCCLTLPTVTFLLIRRFATGRPVIQPTQLRSQEAGGDRLPRFAIHNRVLASLASLPQIALGRMGLVGRHSQISSETWRGSESAYLRAVKPGLVTLWTIRSRARIGHEGRLATDWEYRYTKSLRTDLMILLRALASLPFGQTAISSTDEMQLFGIRLPNLTMVEAVARIETALQREKNAEAVFFVNPDCLNKTFADSEYAAILQAADHVLPDGIGLTVAGRILGTPLRENVNGTDMLPYLCAMLAKNCQTLFLLGGRPGVAERMAEKLVTDYGVQVAGTHHGYFDHATESDEVVDLINRSGASLVLVAFGAPLQEKWIATHRERLRVGALLGVGGLFDFCSGNVKRAPRWLREIGFEWVYRILQEPRRMWRRYIIGNPLFLFRVLVWKHRITINQARQRS